MISKHILWITFLNEPELIFVTRLYSFTYFYLIQIILFSINPLFVHSLLLSSIAMNKNNSIKHHSFVYTLLNDQTVLFTTIQFRISTKFFVYTQLNKKQFYFKQFS